MAAIPSDLQSFQLKFRNYSDKILRRNNINPGVIKPVEQSDEKWSLETVNAANTPEYFFGLRWLGASGNSTTSSMLYHHPEHGLIVKDYGSVDGKPSAAWKADPRALWEVRLHDGGGVEESGFRLHSGKTGQILFMNPGSMLEPVNVGFLLDENEASVHQDQIFHIYNKTKNWGALKGDFFNFVSSVSTEVSNASIEVSGRPFRTFVYDVKLVSEYNSYYHRRYLREFSKKLNSNLKNSKVSDLFVFIHGVGSDFNSFGGYIDCLDRIFNEYSMVADATGRPLSKDNVAILGVNWQSQNMMDMIKSLLSMGDMYAKLFAENCIAKLVEAIGGSNPNIRIHLVAHSMGAQVLLYTLPAISAAANTNIASMFFIQGFAPCSAFLSETEIKAGIGKYPNIGRTEEWVARARTFIQETAKAIGARYHLGWLSETIAKLPALLLVRPENMKLTDFAKHMNRVSGPIIATRTPSFWSDFQVGGAELSFYELSGVLGVRGFVSEKAHSLSLRLPYELQSDPGKAPYAVAEKLKTGTKLFNFDVGDLITDHDDFKNSAIALAHLSALGWVGARKRAVQPRTFAPPAALAPDRWMGQGWRELGERTLTQVCLPGAHDAGTAIYSGASLPDRAQVQALLKTNSMAKLGSTMDFLAGDYLKNDPWGKGSKEFIRDLVLGGPSQLLPETGLRMLEGLMPSLTRTQEAPIAHQLRSGCRYFDLRPVLGPNSQFYLAHGDHVISNRGGKNEQGVSLEVDLGFVGAYGERLEEALDDVRAFAAAPGREHELIVLNISHAADWLNKKNNVDGCRQPLLDLIERRLGAVMIRKFGQYDRIDCEPLSNVLEPGRNVLCLFDRNILGTKPPGDGWYTYLEVKSPDPKTGKRAGPTAQGNMVLFDEYANSRNTARVIDDQAAKYVDRMAARAEADKLPLADKLTGQEVFLFSWTLTLAQNLSLGDMRSIVALAKDHNRHLGPFIDRWIEEGVIAGRSRPNIIYVDAYDRTILDVVARINALPV